MFYFDYWTVFSTLIKFIHELAPRSLWLVLNSVACVASVSNRIMARELEREPKKKKKNKKRGGGREKRKRLPANPTVLENAPWYFTVRFICKFTARQNRSITNHEERLSLKQGTGKWWIGEWEWGTGNGERGTGNGERGVFESGNL